MYKSSWHLTLGDPTFIGWLNTILYFISIILTLLVIRKIKKSSQNNSLKQRLFWIMVFIIVFDLGINKQLDLQTLFLQIGRKIAVAQGWYGERREFQGIFVFIIAIIIFLFIIYLFNYIKNHWKECGITFIGVLMLMLFVVVRTASINHVVTKVLSLSDTFYKWIFELGGNVLIIVGSIKNIAELKEGPRSNFKFDWEK